MFNIGNYFEISRKYFYRNKKDEFIILLNLKDKIINIFDEDYIMICLNLHHFLIYNFYNIILFYFLYFHNKLFLLNMLYNIYFFII